MLLIPRFRARVSAIAAGDGWACAATGAAASAIRTAPHVSTTLRIRVLKHGAGAKGSGRGQGEGAPGQRNASLQSSRGQGGQAGDRGDAPGLGQVAGIAPATPVKD